MRISASGDWSAISRHFLSLYHVNFLVDNINIIQNTHEKILLIFIALISSFISRQATTADYRVGATSKGDGNEPATKVIHTTEAGQLDTLLGEDNFKVVSLTICGSVNDEDFKVLHFNSVVGESQYLYLADAQIENR